MQLWCRISITECPLPRQAPSIVSTCFGHLAPWLVANVWTHTETHTHIHRILEPCACNADLLPWEQKPYAQPLSALLTWRLSHLGKVTGFILSLGSCCSQQGNPSWLGARALIGLDPHRGHQPLTAAWPGRNTASPTPNPTHIHPSQDLQWPITQIRHDIQFPIICILPFIWTAFYCFQTLVYTVRITSSPMWSLYLLMPHIFTEGLLYARHRSGPGQTTSWFSQTFHSI